MKVSPSHEHCRRIHRFATLDEASHALATYIASLARVFSTADDSFSLVLTGGATPRLLYQLLGSGSVANDIPWSHMHLFWGDERMVPPEHEASNYTMAKNSLLDHAPLPRENIHQIETDEQSPEAAANLYERKLRCFWKERPLNADGFPKFDCILLGMGEDGHIASLFPESPLLAERHRWVAACGPSGTPSLPRVTMTIPVITHAKQIIFLISGPQKSAILNEILANPDMAAIKYPAAMIQKNAAPQWFVAP